MELKQEYEIDKDSYYKSKKYVIKIYPENINHIEDLNSRDRDQFINDAIAVYLNRYTLYKNQLSMIQKIKKFVIYSISSIMILALLGGIFRFMLVYTNVVDNEMQNNFEKLFNKYNME